MIEPLDDLDVTDCQVFQFEDVGSERHDWLLDPDANGTRFGCLGEPSMRLSRRYAQRPKAVDKNLTFACRVPSGERA